MRIRLRVTKLAKLRFLGHRDMARLWERTIRRAELPVAYSEGFSPRPKMHFGLALPTGAESIAEYLDIDLRERIELRGLAERLTALLPPGVDVTEAVEVATNATALQAEVEAVSWELCFTGRSAAEAEDAVTRLLEAEELRFTLERKGKPVTEDIRPVITSISVIAESAIVDSAAARSADGEDCVVLAVELSTTGRNIRPSEFAEVLGLGTADRICRIEQWTSIDGRRVSLLGDAAPSTPAEVLVS